MAKGNWLDEQALVRECEDAIVKALEARGWSRTDGLEPWRIPVHVNMTDGEPRWFSLKIVAHGGYSVGVGGMLAAEDRDGFLGHVVEEIERFARREIHSGNDLGLWAFARPEFDSMLMQSRVRVYRYKLEVAHGRS